MRSFILSIVLYILTVSGVQSQVKCFYAQVSVSGVTKAGYIIYKDEITDTDLLRFMENDSLFRDYCCYTLYSDTITIITELANYIRFSNSFENGYIFNRDICDYINVFEIDEISLLYAVKFWPVTISFTNSEMNTSELKDKEVDLITLGVHNGNDFYLYNRSGKEIMENFKSDIFKNIKKERTGNREFEKDLKNNNLIIVTYLYNKSGD